MCFDAARVDSNVAERLAVRSRRFARDSTSSLIKQHGRISAGWPYTGRVYSVRRLYDVYEYFGLYAEFRHQILADIQGLVMGSLSAEHAQKFMRYATLYQYELAGGVLKRWAYSMISSCMGPHCSDATPLTQGLSTQTGCGFGVVVWPTAATAPQPYVLVAAMTGPGDVALMVGASAIVTEQGGFAQSRRSDREELAVPCVAGAKDAMRLLVPGFEACVCGVEGVVSLRSRH